MKKVIISVNGGRADVELNEGVNIAIVDYDVNEKYDLIVDGTEDVVIEVSGSIAEFTKCVKGVEVEIIDYDNLKNGFV